LLEGQVADKGARGLNGKKLGAVIVLLVASIAPALILGGYVANALEPPDFGPMIECLALKNQQINENPQSLNTSLTIYNTGGQTINVNTVKLGQICQSGSPGVAVSVNGTYVDCTAAPLFVIKIDDTAVVNVIVPYTSFPYALSTLHSAKIVSITVVTDEAMYYVESNCTNVN
jgi:hypothetical protein